MTLLFILAVVVLVVFLGVLFLGPLYVEHAIEKDFVRLSRSACPYCSQPIGRPVLEKARVERFERIQMTFASGPSVRRGINEPYLFACPACGKSLKIDQELTSVQVADMKGKPEAPEDPNAKPFPDGSPVDE